MVVVSRILGLLRDIVIARLFGAGSGLDAFLVAFRIPNFFRRLFAEGAFTQAFVPVLVEYRSGRSADETQTLLDQVAGTLSLFLLGVTAVGVLAAPVCIFIFAPGFAAEGARYDAAVAMLRITFPYLFFISLTALAAGVLNTWQRFAIPAVTPALLNISLIVCAVWWSPHMEDPIQALAWGVCLAGIVQLALQLPFLCRIGHLPRLVWPRGHQGVSRIWRLMLPALFAASVIQINLLVDTLMASFLETGSISWLYFSDRLMQFPLGVFGVSLATVILPQLARQHSTEHREDFINTLYWGLRWVVLIAVPASVGLVCLAEPILVSLFYSQAFSVYDIIMTAGSLSAYAWGLTGFILVKILTAGFFARQDMVVPMRAALVALCVNIIGNLLLIVPLAHIGLAFSSSLSACVHAALLYYLLCKDKRLVSSSSATRIALGYFIARVVFAVCVMFMVLHYLVPEFAIWESWSVLLRVCILLGMVLVGVLSYLIALWGLGVRFRTLMLQT